MTEERRKHPRAAGSWDVTVWRVSAEDVSGEQWQGESVDVSAGGLKVKFPGALARGTLVNLMFTPPDGGPMISAVATVVRKDAQGHAFAFASLSYADLVRLQKLVKARS